jgi:hypothetical protein
MAKLTQIAVNVTKKVIPLVIALANNIINQLN